MANLTLLLSSRSKVETSLEEASYSEKSSEKCPYRYLYMYDSLEKLKMSSQVQMTSTNFNLLSSSHCYATTTLQPLPFNSNVLLKLFQKFWSSWSVSWVGLEALAHDFKNQRGHVGGDLGFAALLPGSQDLLDGTVSVQILAGVKDSVKDVAEKEHYENKLLRNTTVSL